jgi:hypothetical protein
MKRRWNFVAMFSTGFETLSKRNLAAVVGLSVLGVRFVRQTLIQRLQNENIMQHLWKP